MKNEFFKFLISNKLGTKIYTGLVILILFCNFIIMIADNFPEGIFIALLVELLIPSIFYFGFYCSSYYNLYKQKKFIKVNSKSFKNIETKSIVLFQRSFTMQPYRMSYPAKINIKPREVNYKFIDINNNIIMLGYVYDLGKFKRYLKPLIFIEDSKILPGVKHVKKIKVRIDFNSKAYHIYFINGEFGINKVELYF